jgi:hypothetical protein
MNSIFKFSNELSVAMNMPSLLNPTFLTVQMIHNTATVYDLKKNMSAS